MFYCPLYCAAESQNTIWGVAQSRFGLDLGLFELDRVPKNGQQSPLKPAASKGYSDLLRPLFFQVDLTLGLDCRNAAWADNYLGQEDPVGPVILGLDITNS